MLLVIFHNLNDIVYVNNANCTYWILNFYNFTAVNRTM